MDFTDDFQDSEAWLSEKIFSQLKDFNETTNSTSSNNKLDSSVETNIETTPIDLSLQTKTFIDLYNSNININKIKSSNSASSDTFEALTNFKELNICADSHNIEASANISNSELVYSDTPPPNDINSNTPTTSGSGILNLKQELLKAQNHHHHYTTAIDKDNQQSIKTEEKNFTKPNLAIPKTQYDFDLNDLFHENKCNQKIVRTNLKNYQHNEGQQSNEEHEKPQLLVIQDENVENYYEMMMKLPENSNKENILVIGDEDDEDNKDNISFIPYSQFIKCMNCDQIFEYFAFTQHICDYDNKKDYIFSEEELKHRNILALKKLLEEDKKYFSGEPACLRQLRENNAKIRKFLKDCLKYDVENTEGLGNRKNDGANECTLCERKFVHASGLARHMEKHALDLIPSTTNAACFENRNRLKVMVKCITCGRAFFSAKNGLDHFKEHHQDETDTPKNQIEQQTEHVKNDLSNDREVLTEDFMNEAIEYLDSQLQDSIFNDSKTENDYLKVIILSSILQCEFCDFFFTDVANLLKHSSTHDPLRGFECNSCEINVGTSKEIFLHYQAECVFSRELLRNNHNLQRLFVCNVCENKFSTLEQLLDHRYSSLHLFPRLNKALNVLQICCEYCGSTFESAADILKHHDERHFKKILNSGYTKRDLSTPKPRQYLCDVCGKSYTQSSHLWQHLRFHRGVKPFACTEPDCNRKFTIRPDLNDHIRKCHTGERPYHCLICGKRFLTGSVFYQHRLIHRGERRYGCEECGKRFYRADALKNHLRIHTGEKPYSCLYCSKNFRQRGDRDKHIRARHANLDENAKNILTALKNGTIPPTRVIPPPQRPPLPPPFPSAVNNDVVFVGNVPFPASMFKPVVSDIENQNNKF